MRVDHTEASDAVALMTGWAAQAPAQARYVCAANVHMAMVAHDRPDFAVVVNAADLVVPDGVPMVWALRLLGLPQRRRVRVTPDVLLELLRACARGGISVGLYGGAPATLAAMRDALETAVPGLRITYSCSPPFRRPTPDEDAAAVREIEDAGVQLLLVGLGCPKQERWMAAHKESLHCVMVGVGAAFPLLAGEVPDAPVWMRDTGLEWLFRLRTQPRRLWRRYVYNNPRFIVCFALQLWRARRAQRRVRDCAESE
jgi:N-acetylglucosaminyldiphosphoundecaprenol N-acetyl-beta-D-mannosaminyltransferase